MAMLLPRAPLDELPRYGVRHRTESVFGLDWVYGVGGSERNQFVRVSVASPGSLGLCKHKYDFCS